MIKKRRKSRKKAKKSRKKSPIVKHSLETYARWKRELSGIHRFSFRQTKNFTPSQKSAITRARNRYAHIIRAIKLGHGVRVVPATRSEIKAAGDRFEHTNIGLVVYSRASSVKTLKKSEQRRFLERYAKKNKRTPEKYSLDDMTDDDVDRLLRLGELENHYGWFDDRTIIYERGRVREQIHIPLKKGETVTELIDYVWSVLNPTHILLSIGKGQSTQSFDKNSWEKYRETLINLDTSVRDFYKNRGENEKDVFNGVYAVWHSGRQLRGNPVKLVFERN